MNHLFHSIAAAAAATCLTLSCTSAHRSGSAEEIEFKTIADSAAWLVPDYFGDTCYVTARYNVVWPEKIGETDFANLRDTLLAATFGQDAGRDFDQAVYSFTHQGFPAMGFDNIPEGTVTVPYSQADDALHETFNRVESSVNLLTTDLLVIGVDYQGYTDRSAHGSVSRRYVNYSLSQQCLLTSAFMFRPEAADSLSLIISRAAADKYPEGTLFPDATFTPDNFQISDGEIIFTYQPYEVGPYSTGIVEVPVSTYTLTPYLTPRAATLLISPN